MKKCIPLLMLFCLLCGLCLSASAAMVTDTLTVKVGYWGMETDDYVEVGTYHWSELEENLELHYQAYSFFRPDAEGEYRIAIDSAYGFYLTDLLSYANIYQDDVLSLQFYTKDQTVGYFTSFTTHELFETRRYYFEDLAAYIHPVEDPEEDEPAWDASEAWAHSRLVPAMLALEDSWVWYDVGTEHTAPNYETMGTGNRFRLLFGQADPLETRTNQTAKYTHTVYVTLKGAPEFGEQPELDAAIGSHTVSFTLTVGNENILDVLSELLQISSSDESILQITGVTVTPDAEYSDLVHVEISYEVLAEGEASITFSLGSETIGSPMTLPASGGETEETPSENEEDQTPTGEPSENGEDQQAEEPSENGEDQQAEEPSENGEDQQTEEPSESGDDQPAEEPSESGDDQPAEEPSGNGEDQQAEKPSENGEDQPAEEPQTQSTEPQTQPTEPQTQPTEPQTQPTEPQSQPTETQTQPTQTPTEPPANAPSEAPTEAATEALTEAPSETPTEAPTEVPVPPDDQIELAAPQTEPEFEQENEQIPTISQKRVILLDAATVSKLQRLREPELEQVIPDLPQTESRQVMQLRLQEQKDAETLRWTAVIALLLLLSGGVSSLLYFKKER